MRTRLGLPIAFGGQFFNGQGYSGFVCRQVNLVSKTTGNRLSDFPSESNDLSPSSRHGANEKSSRSSGCTRTFAALIPDFGSILLLYASSYCSDRLAIKADLYAGAVATSVLPLVMIMRFHKQLLITLVLPGLLCAVVSNAYGQSSDQSLPTPVLGNEINGRIAPLDLGDPRVTRHYYAFEGNSGDLLITIDSKNLNGDMDVFTAITFRPLMKTTLYASSQSGEVTKGLYLRSRQIFVLRIEARTPNDEDGSYHIRFGGTFAPFSGGIPVAENTARPADSTTTSKANNRLSSVGATLPRPVVETPATSEPKLAETEPPAEAKAEAKKTPPAASAKPKPARPAPRNSRSRPSPIRPKPTTSDPAKAAEAKTESDKKETPTPKPAESPGTEKSEVKSTPQEVPLPGAHLIIESKDGTKTDRPMATVRRVLVEGGMIVIVLKTGRVERIPMAGVNRMAIEP